MVFLLYKSGRNSATNLHHARRGWHTAVLPQLEPKKRLARLRQLPFVWAALALALLLLWQYLTVRYNYQGNWTAAFCTGENQGVPPELAPKTYLMLHTFGYDGQMDRYVAHDPWMKRGFEKYIDAPVLRYRRILV